MSEHEETTRHLENFSFSDFITEWNTLEDKYSMVSPFVQGLIQNGYIMREVTGPAGHRVTIRDQVSGDDREILMFGSNNYLGMANEPVLIEATIAAVREYGIGCGGPPLLNGTTTLHRKLERKLAEKKKCGDAVLFSSGYAANVGWCTGLLSSGDYLVYDAQSHASLHDGIKMGQFRAVPFAHNDVQELRRHLMQVRWKKPYTNIIVCVEGVYSMDGDIAPLPEIRQTCTKYGALLAVDDAHGSGVLGKTGNGTAEHFDIEGQIDLYMGTFSKSFGVTGGYVAGRKEMIDSLRLCARSYMFSASLPPSIVAGVLAGIDFIDDHPERLEMLHDNVRYMVEGLRKIGYEVQVETAIIPILVPEKIEMKNLIARFHEEGIFVNGVEFPAVPRDKQRIRASMMATFPKEDLDFALGVFEKLGKEFGILD